MQGRIELVLGKPPRSGTVVAGMVDVLRANGFAATIHLPHDQAAPLPPALYDADLVVQRGLRRDVLAGLFAVESAGVRCCNPIAATIAVGDRLALARRLADAGINVPHTRPAATWQQARRAAAGGPVVVKSWDGDVGRSARVVLAVDGKLPDTPAFGGPWVLQSFVPGDGRVRKIYVAGDRQRALRKRAMGSGHGDPVAPEPFRPSSELSELAAATGAALGLEIYNVDIIVGPDGPCVVDVNPFPGFRHVPDAAALLVAHVQAIARAGRRQ